MEAPDGDQVNNGDDGDEEADADGDDFGDDLHREGACGHVRSGGVNK